MEIGVKKIPDAYAKLKGSSKYESIKGNVYFYGTYGGTIVLVEVYGIPKETEEMAGGFFGFHIHEGNSCTGNSQDAFANTDGHYNPKNEQHPRHAGDLPVLLSNSGIVWMAFYTNRFYPEEVVGKTTVIHGMPDDYRTQPAGVSGEKIACGEIRVWEGEYH